MVFVSHFSIITCSCLSHAFDCSGARALARKPPCCLFIRLSHQKATKPNVHRHLVRFSAFLSPITNPEEGHLLSPFPNRCLVFRECARTSLVLFHWTPRHHWRIARTPRTGLIFQGWAVGAVVAQLLYTETVGGSNPSSPTSLRSEHYGERRLPRRSNTKTGYAVQLPINAPNSGSASQPITTKRGAAAPKLKAQAGQDLHPPTTAQSYNPASQPFNAIAVSCRNPPVFSKFGPEPKNQPS